MSTRLSIINTSARTGILKPSLRTITIASVLLLIPENYLQIPCNITGQVNDSVGFPHETPGSSTLCFLK